MYMIKELKIKYEFIFIFYKSFFYWSLLSPWILMSWILYCVFHLYFIYFDTIIFSFEIYVTLCQIRWRIVMQSPYNRVFMTHLLLPLIKEHFFKIVYEFWSICIRIHRQSWRNVPSVLYWCVWQVCMCVFVYVYVCICECVCVCICVYVCLTTTKWYNKWHNMLCKYNYVYNYFILKISLYFYEWSLIKIDTFRTIRIQLVISYVRVISKKSAISIFIIIIFYYVMYLICSYNMNLFNLTDHRDE